MSEFLAHVSVCCVVLLCECLSVCLSVRLLVCVYLVPVRALIVDVHVSHGRLCPWSLLQISEGLLILQSREWEALLSEFGAGLHVSESDVNLDQGGPTRGEQSSGKAGDSVSARDLVVDEEEEEMERDAPTGNREKGGGRALTQTASHGNLEEEDDEGARMEHFRRRCIKLLFGDQRRWRRPHYQQLAALVETVFIKRQEDPVTSDPSAKSLCLCPFDFFISTGFDLCLSLCSESRYLCLSVDVFLLVL